MRDIIIPQYKAVSSMALTLQSAHTEWGGWERKGNRERQRRETQRKRWLRKNKENTESWGTLHNTFKFCWRVEEFWQTALRGWEQPKTDTRNSNTHRLQLKQASPALRVEDF